MAHLVPEGTPRGAELQTLLKIHGADGWDVAWLVARSAPRVTSSSQLI